VGALRRDSPYGGQLHGGQIQSERDSRWDHYDGHVDIETAEDGYVVFADVPGFEKDDIDLRFEDGLLTIEATREYDDEHTSRSRRVFERVRVPGEVLEDEITASYRNGVLEVHLPIPEAVEDDDSTSIDIE
jgi:HSP20 family protein